jgi:hypothetical protein
MTLNWFAEVRAAGHRYSAASASDGGLSSTQCYIDFEVFVGDQKSDLRSKAIVSSPHAFVAAAAFSISSIARTE